MTTMLQQSNNRPTLPPGASAMPLHLDQQEQLDTSPPSAPPGSDMTGNSNKPINPLTDLISSEHIYVEQLASVIKRVAAAWSKHNFPPRALDQMFRAIEGCYRINKHLLSQLNDIGPTPASPKALGDLLMRWIDDIEPAYLMYSAAYRSGFDNWQPVASTPKLAGILASLPPGVNTLDALFILPHRRLRYYKKLYTKLLESTQPGRSDHRLLSAANEKLDELISHCESAMSSRVDEEAQEEEQQAPPPAVPEKHLQSAPEAIAASRTATLRQPLHTTPTPPRSPIKAVPLPSGSNSNSIVESRTSSYAPSAASSSRSGSTGRTSSQINDLSLSPHHPNSNSSLATSVSSLHLSSVDELETRLDTARTLDIFNLRPKKCRLQINPAGLPYRRTVRFDKDVDMSFRLSDASLQQRQAEGNDVQLPNDLVVARAHIFLLTDLFMICQRRPEVNPETGSDMWLLFPPLAGKHLQVSPVNSDAEGREFAITVMKREVILIRCSTKMDRDQWLGQFDDCIRFVGNTQIQPLRLNTDTRTLGRSPSALSTATVSAQDVLQNGGVYSPMLGPAPSPSLGSSLSPGDGPNRESPISSTYSSTSADPPPSPYDSRRGPSSTETRAPSRSSQNALSNSSRSNSPYQAGPPQSIHQQQYGNSSDGRKFYQMPQNDFQRQPLPPPPPPEQWRRPSTTSLPPNSIQPGHLGTTPAPVMEAQRSAPLPLRSSSGYPSSYNGGQPGLRPDAARSLGSLRDFAHQQPPPVPQHSFDSFKGQNSRSNSAYAMSTASSRQQSFYDYQGVDEDSPPSSPRVDGPTTNQVIAQMKCKVFLQTSHQQWKSLGTSRLMLYLQQPGNTKQLVVTAENRDKSILISTIVLSDGVERVGKTGLAITISDQGVRTGIIYMIQLKTESSATGLFNTLLAGSSRKSVAN